LFCLKVPTSVVNLTSHPPSPTELAAANVGLGLFTTLSLLFFLFPFLPPRPTLLSFQFFGVCTLIRYTLSLSLPYCWFFFTQVPWLFPTSIHCLARNLFPPFLPDSANNSVRPYVSPTFLLFHNAHRSPPLRKTSCGL